jgi:DNA repair protein RadC
MECSKTITLNQIAEIQLSYKTTVKASLRPKIASSRDAYEILKDLWDPGRIEFLEQFKVMLLNRANRVLGVLEVSSGSSTGTVVDPKLVFVAAIKANACGIIIAHNHPSGNLTPSQSDIDLTRKIKEGGKMLLQAPLNCVRVLQVNCMLSPAAARPTAARTSTSPASTAGIST